MLGVRLNDLFQSRLFMKTRPGDQEFLSASLVFGDPTLAIGVITTRNRSRNGSVAQWQNIGAAKDNVILKNGVRITPFLELSLMIGFHASTLASNGSTVNITLAKQGDIIRQFGLFCDGYEVLLHAKNSVARLHTITSVYKYIKCQATPIGTDIDSDITRFNGDQYVSGSNKLATFYVNRLDQVALRTNTVNFYNSFHFLSPAISLPKIMGQAEIND
jgi:hypothetical protein